MKTPLYFLSYFLCLSFIHVSSIFSINDHEKLSADVAQTERIRITKSRLPKSEVSPRKLDTNDLTKIPSKNTTKSQDNIRLQSHSQHLVRSLGSSQTQPNAAWMSGHHGLSYSMTGGFNFLTAFYNVNAFVQQMATLYPYGVRWFVLNLSSMYGGDQYLAPHSVLTNLNRASTPKRLKGDWIDGDAPLEEYEDFDLFGEALNGFDSIGIKVIAYMSAQGPAMLQSGEHNTYDYRNASPYVDSCALCPELTNTLAPFCECAPSVWQWRRYVNTQYNAMDDETLKKAYAEKIVEEYASNYGVRVAGYIFDQVYKADVPKIHDAVRTYNPNAVLAFNQGQQMPLKNNNPPYNDITFRLLKFGDIMSYHCNNYPAITSVEGTTDGYFHENEKGLLGHVHTPFNRGWSYGHPVWDVTRAQEWQSRVINAGGAWTWNVKRAKVGEISMIDEEDIIGLRTIYEGLRDGPPYVETCGTPYTEHPTMSTKPSSRLSITPSKDPSSRPSKTSKPSTRPSYRPSLRPSDGPSITPSNNPSSNPSESLKPSTIPSYKPSIMASNDPSSNPSESLKPSARPSHRPSITPSNSSKPSEALSSRPSDKPSLMASNDPSSKPSKSSKPSRNPTFKPVEMPQQTPTDDYNYAPTDDYSYYYVGAPTPNSSLRPSDKPSLNPSTIRSNNPLYSTKPSIILAPNAAWMSEHHGISFRIPGGVNYVSSFFETDMLIQQMIELLQTSRNGIRWIIINLSTYHGDRYLSPHSVLSNLNRGSTPKVVPKGEWKNGIDLSLEQYDDRELFGEIITGLNSIGIRVIAYMSAQGPTLLQSGEEKSYDYSNKSPYVDSCALCPSLIGMPFSICNCAPSVWKWKNYVLERYNATDDGTLKKAYAEIIIGEYASKYGEKLAGFAFDHVYHLKLADKKVIHDVVRFHNPKAVISFNSGQRIPLRNNNAPYEDFTFGYPKYKQHTEAPDCENYPAIISIEQTSNGFLKEIGKESLGHFQTPIRGKWNNNTIAWNTAKAQEWQSRVMIAKGAWTWMVQLGTKSARSKIQDNDAMFLKDVYLKLQNSSLYKNSSLYIHSCEQSQAPSVSILQKNPITTANTSPTSNSSANPTISHPSSINSPIPNINRFFPSSMPSKEPLVTSLSSRQTATWMSGYHGISFPIICGFNYISSFYDVDGFIQQFNDNLLNYGVRWVIVNLSSLFHGDRYLSPHSVLTNLNRGSTPKAVPIGEWKNDIDMPLEQYNDRDLFGEILRGLDSIGVRVIAYMSAQGPTMLKSGERKAYDYENNSPYVDSCALCPSLTNTQAPFCACAPSVWKWKKYVYDQYNSATVEMIKKAYAELIVREYASKYGKKLAGFAFDQASRSFADIALLYDTVRTYNPVAVLSFANGARIPLQLKNYPYEDFTFGNTKSLREHVSSSCENYGAITSIESTNNGFFHLNGKGSLGHIHTPIRRYWFDGKNVWTVEKAQEWQSRAINAKGAWTWGVTRGSGKHFSLISLYDIEFLKRVYNGLRDETDYISTCGESIITNMPSVPTN